MSVFLNIAVLKPDHLTRVMKIESLLRNFYQEYRGMFISEYQILWQKIEITQFLTKKKC